MCQRNSSIPKYPTCCYSYSRSSTTTITITTITTPTPTPGGLEVDHKWFLIILLVRLYPLALMLSCLLCPGKHDLQMRMKYLRRSQYTFSFELAKANRILNSLGKCSGCWLDVDGLQTYFDEVRGPTFDKQHGSCMAAAWQHEPSLTSKDSLEALWSSTFWGRFCIVAQRLPLFHPTGSDGIEAVKNFSPAILLSWACPQGLFHMHSNKWRTIFFYSHVIVHVVVRISDWNLKNGQREFSLGPWGRWCQSSRSWLSPSWLAWQIGAVQHDGWKSLAKFLQKPLQVGNIFWWMLCLGDICCNSFPSVSPWSLWALKLHLCFCMLLWIWCFKSWNILKPWMEACLSDRLISPRNLWEEWLGCWARIWRLWDAFLLESCAVMSCICLSRFLVWF